MKNKLRVCINGITENSEIRGPVRYICELISHLDKSRFEIVLLAGEWQRSIYGSLEDSISVRYIDIGKSKARRALFFFWSVPKLLRNLRIDVYHIPDTNPLPISRGNARIVSTIHDSAEYVAPQRFSWYQALYRRFISKTQAHGSDAIITVSESSRRDIVKYLDVVPQRVSVTPLGVVPLNTDIISSPTAKDKEPRHAYVLYVGVIEHVKNVDRLVEAYALLDPEMREMFSLYLVGRKSNAFPRVNKLIEQYGLNEHVQFFGYLSDSDLHRLYENASLFAYLSEYEGFGLPVLEAMRYRIPVLASNRTSIPEVAGDAAMLVETDVNSIARGLDALLRNRSKRDDLGARGFLRAATFRWQQTARATEKVYEQDSSDTIPEG